MTRAWLVHARWLVVPVALAAGLVGGAGAATLALEHRLAGAVADSLSFRALRYNPLTGVLVLDGVQARRTVAGLALEAATVRARVNAASVVEGPITLRDVEVVAPRLRVRAAALSTVVAELAATFERGRPASVAELVLTGGSVRIERPDAPPLLLRDVHVRLDRLVRGAADRAPAFVATLDLDGAEIHITGHALAGGDVASAGYVTRLRGRDVDLAALQPLVHGAKAIRLERGRGDLDVELLALAGRLVLSGRARLGPVVAHAAAPAVSALRAEEAVVVVDRFDVAAGAGRLSRLELRAPSLTVRLAPGGLRQVRRLGALLPDVVVRRLRVSEGAVTLVDQGRRRAVRRLEVALQAREQAGGAGVRLALAGRADGRRLDLERSLPGLDAGLTSGLIAIAHAVEAALAE